MRTLVCGSRHFNDYGYMKYIDNNYRYKHLGFNGLFLTCYGKETGLKLVKDENYNWMYWIVREPDFKSKNFYSITNARENCKLFFLAHMNSDEVDINKIRLPWASAEAH